MNTLVKHIFRRDYAALQVALAREDVNAFDDGLTPLMQAVLDDEDDPKMVKFLLSHGADPNMHDTDQAWTALHFAARDQKVAIVRVLLDAGSAVDSLNVFGNTPLWHTVSPRGNPEVVEMLLEAGADPRKRNGDGVSPLDIAKALKKKDLVKLMQKFRRRASSPVSCRTPLVRRRPSPKPNIKP